MEKKNSISIKIRKTRELIAKVYFCVDYDPRVRNKEELIEDLIKGVEKTLIDGIYFKNRQSLRQHLRFQIFGEDKLENIPKLNFDRERITTIIGEATKKCHENLPIELIRIFVFPTFNSFVKDEMSGVTGFSTLVIHTFINPIVKGWETALKESICHEFNHIVYNKHHKKVTLLDNIIFEGLAENFREYIINGKQAPWTKALPLQECKRIFSKIEELLNSKSREIYRSVFFDNKKYPRWSGYSIGYQIVKSFLINNKEMGWEEIMILDPKEILEKSGF